jgi:hypothetical protein
MKLSVTVIHIDRRRFRGRCCFSLLYYDQFQNNGVRHGLEELLVVIVFREKNCYNKSSKNCMQRALLLPSLVGVLLVAIKLNWLLVTKLLVAIVVEFCVILLCSISNFEIGFVVVNIVLLSFRKGVCRWTDRRSNTLDFRQNTELIIADSAMINSVYCRKLSKIWCIEVCPSLHMRNTHL